MFETQSLPSELISSTVTNEFVSNEKVQKLFEPEVRKYSICGIDELQYLYVAPRTMIKSHGHRENQWEVWCRLDNKTAYVCLVDEKHELINNSSFMLSVMAIKGKGKYNFKTLAELFGAFGFKVYHGSMIIDEWS